MKPFKVFLSPQVDVPDAVLQAMAARLKRYFDTICRAMSPRKFTDATVKLSPHAQEVGPVDLVGYITQQSLVVTLFDKVYETSITHSLPGTPGGGTKKMPNGAIVSEVFYTGGLMALKKADLQGVALANLMFHEFAHNKHTSDPVAIQNGEIPNGNFVHDIKACGGGILADRTSASFRLSSTQDINPGNVRAMARVLDASNRQETCGLFDDELGF